MADVNVLSLAVANAYWAITRRAMPDSTRDTIRDRIISTSTNDAKEVVSEMETIVPQLEDPNFNAYAVTSSQRIMLKEALERSFLFQSIQEYRAPISFLPLDVSLSGINDPNIIRILGKGFLQSHSWVGESIYSRHVKCISPNLELGYLYGTEPMIFGLDQSRRKPATVSSFEMRNLGLNYRPAGSWVIYGGVDYSGRSYQNNTDRDCPLELGDESAFSVNGETIIPFNVTMETIYWADRLASAVMPGVFGHDNLHDNMLGRSVLKYRYLWKDVNRAIETELDPSVESGESSWEYCETYIGPAALKIRFSREEGNFTPLFDSPIGFTREMWTFTPLYSVLAQNYKCNLAFTAGIGWYLEKSTRSGSATAEQRVPNDASSEPTFSQVTPAPASPPISVDQYLACGSAEITFPLSSRRMLVPGDLDLSLRGQVSQEYFKRLEGVVNFKFGFDLGRWVGADWSVIYNDVPELRSTGDQVSHRLDAFVNVDCTRLLSYALYGDSEPDLNLQVRGAGWWLWDNIHPNRDNPRNYEAGWSLNAVLGFNSGLGSSASKGVNRHEEGSVYYVPSSLSPNNEALLREHLEREYVERAKNGTLLMDGAMGRHLTQDDISYTIFVRTKVQVRDLIMVKAAEIAGENDGNIDLAKKSEYRAWLQEIIGFYQQYTANYCHKNEDVKKILSFIESDLKGIFGREFKNYLASATPTPPASTPISKMAMPDAQAAVTAHLATVIADLNTRVRLQAVPSEGTRLRPIITAMEAGIQIRMAAATNSTNLEAIDNIITATNQRILDKEIIPSIIKKRKLGAPYDIDNLNFSPKKAAFAGTGNANIIAAKLKDFETAVQKKIDEFKARVSGCRSEADVDVLLAAVSTYIATQFDKDFNSYLVTPAGAPPAPTPPAPPAPTTPPATKTTPEQLSAIKTINSQFDTRISEYITSQGYNTKQESDFMAASIYDQRKKAYIQKWRARILKAADQAARDKIVKDFEADLKKIFSDAEIKKWDPV
jgi:hypothetical protein